MFTAESELYAVTEASAAALYQDFFQTVLNEREAQGGEVTEGELRARAFGWWQAAVTRVPAYADFLRKINFPLASFTADAWSTLPIVDKRNYVSHYPLAELCWDGRLNRAQMIAVSSGSTGQPFFWPRGLAQELKVAYRFESVYRQAFRAHERTTLVVICFALGTWVGGMFTHTCSTYLAQKGYAITVVTPGLNIGEILRSVKTLAPQFEQVVLAGYPPFIRDVLETGTREGVDWVQYNLKMVFAGEVFSEVWRDNILAHAGCQEVYTGTAALYGTADAGVLGNETPLSIVVRRFFSANPELTREFFGESRLPTIVQYDPTDRYFELVDGELIFSAPTIVPLLRYNIHDRGGLFSYKELMAYLGKHNFDPLATLREAGYPEESAALPFVYLFGRSDFTLSFYGANVYVENIQAGLEDESVREAVTGKFVMSIEHEATGAERLLVRVELRPGVKTDEVLTQTLATSISGHLRRLNTEFANYVPSAAALLLIELYPAGEPKYFPVGVKHRYSR